MQLALLWLSKASSSTAIALTGLSKTTIADFYKYFRQLVSDSLDPISTKIGGENIIVEIDESKMGKRKYERGHRVDGVWVLGGIERTPLKKAFYIEVPDRKESTLLPILKEYILPGSIVYSDMWRGYINIENELNIRHSTVNHSKEFVSDEGVHTNSIEGSWAGLKLNLSKRHRVKRVQPHLTSYIWRKLNKECLWNSFIKALVDVEYI
jgi:transposase-like protein